MNFLFWNLNKRPIRDIVAALADETAADIVILAECEVDDVILLETLNSISRGRYGFATNYVPESRVKVLTTLRRNLVRAIRTDNITTIYRVNPPVGEEFILVPLHLSSKLFESDVGQALVVTRLANSIRNVETELGHTRTIIVGDLNMNPFEPGLVGADALHAVMTREVALRESRVVAGEERLFFYNPMWSRFGDSTTGPPGTYYYPKTGQVCYFWNIFDQVLFRPSLLSNFRDETLNIITKTKTTSLLSGRGFPDAVGASDHLPITFSLNY